METTISLRLTHKAPKLVKIPDRKTTALPCEVLIHLQMWPRISLDPIMMPSKDLRMVD